MFSSIEYFAAYHELDQGAFNWELAEQAANTSRFGSPDTELALQLICRVTRLWFSSGHSNGGSFRGIQTGTPGGFDICNFVTGRPGEAFVLKESEPRRKLNL